MKVLVAFTAKIDMEIASDHQTRTERTLHWSGRHQTRTERTLHWSGIRREQREPCIGQASDENRENPALVRHQIAGTMHTHYLHPLYCEPPLHQPDVYPSTCSQYSLHTYRARHSRLPSAIFRAKHKIWLTNIELGQPFG